MENKVILEMSKIVTLDDTKVEIKGSVYSEPIAKSENHTCHSMITFRDLETNKPWGIGIQLFPKELNKKELKHEINFRVKNINNFKEHEPR